MDITTIQSDIKKFIESSILDNAVKIDNQTVLQDAGMDSFSIVEIILFIERKYGVGVPNDKLLPENFASIEAIAATVQELLTEPK